MLPPSSEPQPTGASVAVGGAVFAASAMLTGLALRNKSPLPLAAGLAAAAAGLSMMKKPKGDSEGVAMAPENEVPAEAPDTTNTSLPAPSISCLATSGCACGGLSRFQILDESDLDDDAGEEAATQDWVDADAVAFTSHTPSGVTPPSASASLPSHATSFPLLDDDGNVVVGHQMLPVKMPAVLAESAEEFGFPLGPLIWEPESEESMQICAGPEEDFLWFGSRREGVTITSPYSPETFMQMPGAMSLPALTVLATPAPSPSWAPNASASFQLTESPAPESVASILESLRAEAVRRGETMIPQSVHAMAQTGGPHVPGRAAANEPLSFADWMLASQQSPSDAHASLAPSPSQSSPRPTPSPLPSPRKAGEAPQFQIDGTRIGTPAHSPVAGECEFPHRPSLVYHRSVTPVAPVQGDEESGEDRPLALFLAVLILTTALLAVAIWGHGYGTQKETSPAPWTQEPVTPKERATASAVPSP